MSSIWGVLTGRSMAFGHFVIDREKSARLRGSIPRHAATAREAGASGVPRCSCLPGLAATRGGRETVRGL